MAAKGHNYAPEDIVNRLFRRKFWLQEVPVVRVTGEPGKFGRLIFDFEEDSLSYSLRIPITGRGPLLEVVYEALNDYVAIVDRTIA